MWSLPNAVSKSLPLLAFASICSTIVLGDESGYSVGLAQQTKLAAIEAMWKPNLRLQTLT